MYRSGESNINSAAKLVIFITLCEARLAAVLIDCNSNFVSNGHDAHGVNTLRPT